MEQWLSMNDLVSLLDRPVYGVAQIDRILSLYPGTAQRWILGYTRKGRSYPSVIRADGNDDSLVTWGEFVETRLLAGYREAGVPLIHMRPTIERLRTIFATPYPLAMSKPFLQKEGRELVLKIQNEVGLENQLRLVVVRNDQLVLADAAARFVESVEFGDGAANRIRLLPNIEHVFVDPLRQFGEPTVRSVRTDIIAELVRAGDRISMIAELYDLTTDEVESAVRYELIRGPSVADEAA